MGFPIAVVVPTKDRPDEVRRLLSNLRDQTLRPACVVIVDGSGDSVEAVTREFAADLPIVFRRHLPPSTSAQRNAGIRAVPPEIPFITLLDDDVILATDAMEAMVRFWRTAPDSVVGAAMNMMNPTAGLSRFVKRLAWVERLGFYRRDPGGVALSGWHSALTTVTADTRAEWLPAGAVVYRASWLRDHCFDEFYESYGYLEDLDLSYSLSRVATLCVVADARFWHHAATAGRVSAEKFGRYEVKNRLHFVRKHHLSLWRCHLALTARTLVTLGETVLRPSGASLGRLKGNASALLEELGWQPRPMQAAAGFRLADAQRSPAMARLPRAARVVRDLWGQIDGGTSLRVAFVGAFLAHYVAKSAHRKVLLFPDMTIRLHGARFRTRRATVDFWAAWAGYEASLWEQLQRIAGVGTFVDVGAHFGRYSVLMAARSWKVYAFEPMDSSYRALVTNIELNGLKDRVTAFPFGLGETTREARLRFQEHKPGEASLVPEINSSQNGERVLVKSLDDVLSTPLEQPVVLKIDTEGSELSVLKGAREFIRRNRPIINVEIWENDEHELRRFLEEFGYRRAGETWVCEPPPRSSSQQQRSGTRDLRP